MRDCSIFAAILRIVFRARAFPVFLASLEMLYLFVFRIIRRNSVLTGTALTKKRRETGAFVFKTAVSIKQQAPLA